MRDGKIIARVWGCRIDFVRGVERARKFCVEVWDRLGESARTIDALLVCRAGIVYLGRVDIGRDVRNKVVPFEAFAR